MCNMLIDRDLNPCLNIIMLHMSITVLKSLKCVVIQYTLKIISLLGIIDPLQNLSWRFCFQFPSIRIILTLYRIT
jgi:hypothetical protein